jgi:hypothetical protein
MVKYPNGFSGIPKPRRTIAGKALSVNDFPNVYILQKEICSPFNFTQTERARLSLEENQADHP